MGLKSWRRLAIASAALYSAALVARAGPAPAGEAAREAPVRAQAALTKKPAVTRKGDGFEIAFAVGGETDVAVDVLDAGGKAVRRLGAALLGAKGEPPSPFKPGLEQSILWDGRDAAGRPATGGPFKVRVRLGLKAEFDRFIGWEEMLPLDLGMVMIQGIAVGPDRSLYVISNQGAVGSAGRSETRIWVLSKEGKYLRTIYPYPATMDPGKLRGAEFLSDEPNRLAPRIYDRVCPSYLPQMRAVLRQSMAATSDGRLVFINGFCTELYRFGPRCLLVMGTDGSIPRERLDGPTIGAGVVSGYTHLALSPDEKSAYYCGLNTGEYGKPQHVLSRVGLSVSDKPEAIFGKASQAGAGKEGLNDPRGVATDKEGHVYVCDFANDRVVVLEADGKYLAEMPVKGPEVISVHPSTSLRASSREPVERPQDRRCLRRVHARRPFDFAQGFKPRACRAASGEPGRSGPARAN